jgi:hypothetical protein
MLGPDWYLQAAQVHPLLGGERLGRVPRTALRTRGPRGLFRPGLLIIERLVVVELVAGQPVIAVFGPFPARVR